MGDTTISAILEAAKAQPPELQGQWIAEQAIAAARAADAGISNQALQAEFEKWFEREWGASSGPLGAALAVGWACHLLRGGRHVSTPSPKPRPGHEFQRPTMDEVMQLAKVFGLEVNDCYALMWLVVTSLAAWGDNGALNPGGTSRAT
jgi:hypothetical protein